MLNERDEFAAFEPFIDLPSKDDYADYYRVIDHPVSLKTLKKGVKGVRGKYAATGISLYSSWAAFEEEASYIWKNAVKYNEDGSPIFVLAKEFQVSQTILSFLLDANPKPAFLRKGISRNQEGCT